MKSRLISVACMLPFVIFLAIGKLPLLILCFALCAVGMFEFYRGFEKLEIKASKPVAAALLLALYLAAYASLYYTDNFDLFNQLLPFWFFLAIFFSLLLIIVDKNHNILGPCFTLVGVVYIGYFILHIALIERVVPVLAWLPIVIATMADTGGFFGGLYFGKHKLCPELSPKKTVEGCIGGIILGTVASIIFGLLFYKGHFVDCLVMGIIGSVLAELGDLSASAFKRKMGIKDYSNLIPGHGGILDRLDSFTFVAPFVFYYVTLLIEK